MTKKLHRAEEDVIKASFDCAACGKVAATVYYLPPNATDPRFDPEPAGVPPGVGTIDEDRARVSIEGGPVPVTISLLVEKLESGRMAVSTGDAENLAKAGFAPFWCPTCRTCYCERHWDTDVVFDEGFYDCTYGMCPEGHRHKLDD